MSRDGTQIGPAELLKTPAEILEYLDLAIRLWRGRRDAGDSKASAYVDAFQAVRVSLFGQGLPADR